MFEWDENKNRENIIKHHISFETAKKAFFDPNRIITKDDVHSEIEERFFCFGEVDGGILTVLFSYRKEVIRIFGAGYWRKGKKYYEKENQLHR